MASSTWRCEALNAKPSAAGQPAPSSGIKWQCRPAAKGTSPVVGEWSNRYKPSTIRSYRHGPFIRPRPRLTRAGGRVAIYGCSCRDCGRSDVPLEVHHINGDPTDNRIRNLVPLCRDCYREATFPGI